MSQTLVVLPSARAAAEGGRIFVDRKMLDGLARYAALWPGPVRCLLRQCSRDALPFGTLADPVQLPFAIDLIADDLHDLAGLNDAAVVLAAGDNHLDLGLAQAIAPPTVYIIEYTLETRLRILSLGSASPLRKAKSAVWTILTERKRRRAFRAAAGLQCNGTPSYLRYRDLTPQSLLYFDTRAGDAQQITPAALAAKADHILRGEPLRLAFSGRLETMKGSDHLIPVAIALRALDVPFTLTIFGDGSLRALMEQAVRDAGLTEQVRFAGAVSFDDELLPTLIDAVDLFVCCHRQADPSCTYLETYSAGVPIVGYDNEAFEGVLTLGPAGIATPMNRPALVAEAIARLDRDRPAIVAMAREAARIAAANTFEQVFAERIAHLRQVADSASPRSAEH